jgi:Flp pilus assembly protein TadG
MAITRIRLDVRSERGAELIEFALILPILILLLAGIFEFGLMFRSYEAVTNAAREGARVGVLPGYAAADVQNRVSQYLASAGLPGAFTVNVTNVPVSTPAGTFNATSVDVSYTYNMSILAGVAPFFGGTFGSIPLRAVSVMRTETQAAP